MSGALLEQRRLSAADVGRRRLPRLALLAAARGRRRCARGVGALGLVPARVLVARRALVRAALAAGNGLALLRVTQRLGRRHLNLILGGLRGRLAGRGSRLAAARRRGRPRRSLALGLALALAVVGAAAALALGRRLPACVQGLLLLLTLWLCCRLLCCLCCLALGPCLAAFRAAAIAHGLFLPRPPLALCRGHRLVVRLRRLCVLCLTPRLWHSSHRLRIWKL